MLYPFVYLLFVGGSFHLLFQKHEVNFKRVFAEVFISQLLLHLLYFIMTKITYGVWVAHYGADTHVHIDIKSVYENFIDYFLKFTVSYRYIPEPIRRYYNYETIHLFFLVAFGVFFVLTPFLIKKYFSADSSKIIFFLLGSYVLMLLPVLNLDLSYTFEIQSDRYGYIASLFFYAIVIVIAERFLHRKLFMAFSGIHVVLSAVLLYGAVSLWKTIRRHCIFAYQKLSTETFTTCADIKSSR